MADTTLGKVTRRNTKQKNRIETFELARDYCCGKNHNHVITFGNLEYGKRRKPVEVFCKTCAEAKGTYQVVCWLNREWVEMYRGKD